MDLKNCSLNFQVAEKTALLRPIELKIVPMALEGSAFRSKVLDTDELMGYCGFFAVSICLLGYLIFTNLNRKKLTYLCLVLTEFLCIKEKERIG